MSIIFVSLLACPAEQLGIDLPSGGAASISQEDLRRDVAIVERDGEDGFFRRMGQMGAQRDGDCAVRGRGERLRLVADDALGHAALISLAKGWDTAELDRTVAFCWTGEGTKVALTGAKTPGGNYDWRVAEADTRALYTKLTQ